MLIKEYRIPLPFTVEEFRKGHAFMSAKSSKIMMEESSGESLELVTDEPFENENGKGRFVHRVFHLSSRIPIWVRKLLRGTEQALRVEELSWHQYPYIKTVYTCPLLGGRLTFIVETRHADDAGYTHNIHNLDDQTLASRIVEFVDISTEDKKHFQSDEDTSRFVSKKTKRGPLRPGWQQKTKPVMCAYKLVRIDLNYWGFQKKLENVAHDIIKGVYLRSHRQAFVWIDEWIDVTYDDILKVHRELYESISKHPSSSPSLPASTSTSTSSSSDASRKKTTTTTTSSTTSTSGKRRSGLWLRSKL
eukprot:TRINITY_DN13068_c0_g1_i1.p1 TRINITY_DN13068_c0_g1~~TRINITY_DN13068_c0_g1_i1.p1  ORF type:complete len:304 (+),score=35.70 TRINITY_DN13068_c0_g1_i1:59-970(+)